MTNDEYVVFEKPFLELARPLMERLRQTLTDAGTYGEMDLVEVVDKDVARGLSFQSKEEPDLFVELMLEDGGEHGYEGVGIHMCASIFADGVIWAPGNFSEDVSITETDELARRFADVDSASLALLASQAWDATRERKKQAPAER